MIRPGVCISYLVELALATHQVTDEYKIALYSPDADLSEATRKYTTEGECVGDGYVRGGVSIKAKVFQDGRSVCIGFSDPVWELVTLTAGGALIYNSSKQNRAVVVFKFQSPKTAGNGPFKVKLPRQVVKLGVANAKSP